MLVNSQHGYVQNKYAYFQFLKNTLIMQKKFAKN